MVLGNLFQGLSGNMSEVSKDSLSKDYGHLLIEKEEIQAGYALIRDLVIFTNIRILFVDRQGTTGKKARYKSIFLMNIINVELETAGAMLDDSELTIEYLDNIRLKAHSESRQTLSLEFPKRYEMGPLYTMLMKLAYENRLRANE